MVSWILFPTIWIDAGNHILFHSQTFDVLNKNFPSFLFSNTRLGGLIESTEKCVLRHKNLMDLLAYDIVIAFSTILYGVSTAQHCNPTQSWTLSHFSWTRINNADSFRNRTVRCCLESPMHYDYVITTFVYVQIIRGNLYNSDNKKNKRKHIHERAECREASQSLTNYRMFVSIRQINGWKTDFPEWIPSELEFSYIFCGDKYIVQYSSSLFSIECLNLHWRGKQLFLNYGEDRRKLSSLFLMNDIQVSAGSRIRTIYVI